MPPFLSLNAAFLFLAVGSNIIYIDADPDKPKNCSILFW